MLAVLKKEFAQAAQDAKRLESWIRAQGCDATYEQAQAFLQEKQAKVGELSDDELNSVAGGECTSVEALAFTISAGLACAIMAIHSARVGDVGAATQKPAEGLLCN